MLNLAFVIIKRVISTGQTLLDYYLEIWPKRDNSDENFMVAFFFYTELVNFQELQAYDVADLLKQYFRELPECLLTNKLSEVFINIFICKFPISSSI